MALRGIQEYIARDVNNIARVEDKQVKKRVRSSRMRKVIIARKGVATVTKVGGAWRDSQNYEFLRQIIDVNQC